ncbi:MAG: sigma-70 family RNA polymerase sigma factor [Candidatus Acidiferrum sp.]
MEIVTKTQLADALRHLATDRNHQDSWRVLFLGAWGTGLSAANRTLRGQIDLAKDVTQEAFQRLIKYCNFQELQDPDAFLSYFRAVCRNVARDALTRFAPELAAQVPLEELETPSPRVEKPATPEELARAEQLKRELLAALDPADEQLFKLLIEGYTLPEVSSRLNLTYTNAAVRLHRLRLMLRKYMQDKDL